MTFGIFPHQGTLMDMLWERSALRYAGKVATPTLLVHGENDNDVPISEAEQFFIALKGRWRGDSVCSLPQRRTWRTRAETCC